MKELKKMEHSIEKDIEMKEDCCQDLINKAFQKLQSAIYFEKQNLHLRHQMVEFCNKDIKQELKKLEDRLKDPKDSFVQELQKIGLFLLPKKIGKKEDEKKEDNLILNDYEYENNIVERIMIYADIPIELHIISVMWLILFGSKLDLELDKYCWGNRLVIDDDIKEIKKGRRLYKPYQKQYQQWWSKATQETNHLLKNGENVCILNLDIRNYFHSVRIDFDKLKKESDVEPKDERLWDLFVQIHVKYNDVLKKYGIRDKEDLTGCALPVGLLSSSLLGNWYLMEFDRKVNEALRPVYYGRYVDDILIVTKSPEKPENVPEFLKNLHLGFTMEKKDDQKCDDTMWHFSDFPNLKLQQDKIFLYYFDHHYSNELLSKFEIEQKERSSEYRFLSDEEDTHFKDDFMDFESCFYQEESTKARFKPQIENKFKLAVFLAKFIRKRIERGKDYGKEKEKQIKKYFQGSILIKHYYFWEKLFTIFVVSDDGKSIVELYQAIEKEVGEHLEIKVKDWPNLEQKVLDEIKDNLKEYLKDALCTALSIKHDVKTDELVEKKLGLVKKDWVDYHSIYYNRAHYEKQLLGSLYKDGKYDLENVRLPYDLHLFEFFYALSYNKIMECNENNPDALEFDITKIIKIAIDKYTHHNKGVSEEKLENISLERKELPFPVIELKDEETAKDKMTIACVNKLVDKKVVASSRRGKRHMKSQDVEVYDFILDNLIKTKEYDMFVMPELSLPWDMLPSFIQFSRIHQVAFVAGMEYKKIGNVVYNFVLTCLPVIINHSKDCLPVFRLKKEYAPIEKDYSVKELFDIPKTEDKYILFKWKGLHFTVFNCFELTNVADRSKFVSIVDALIAIAYNHDVPYYDNIAEVISRDLHCYMVLNNVSEPGSSQIIAPKKTEFKTLLKTIRGTTPRNMVAIETAEIDIKGLRLYQRYLQQDKDKSFKPLPAGYKRDVERLKNV